MTHLPADIPANPLPSGNRAVTNVNAIVSLVAGLVTWGIGWLGSCALTTLLVIHPLFGMAGWCPGIIGLLSTVTGIVTGHVALRHINQRPDVHKGRSLALTGLALNYLGLALAIGTLCLMVFGFAGLITYALTLPDGALVTPTP